MVVGYGFHCLSVSVVQNGGVGIRAMDRITPELRSINMRAIRSKDTKPELAIWRMVHGMGYRYRLHVGGLPGGPDLVFSTKKKVIFVHGCFWHQHDQETCRISRKPKLNTRYWLSKLERNVQRDRESRAMLEKAGWSVLVIWECEVACGTELARFIQRRPDDVVKNVA